MAELHELVGRWYDDLWNAWNVQVLEQIAHPEVVMRGSLGPEMRGHHQVMAYMGAVRASFSDFHNEVEDLVVDGDRAFAKLTYSGTHDGRFDDVAPTGRTFAYTGLVRFAARGGKLVEVYVLGDVRSLRLQLTGSPEAPIRPTLPHQAVIPTLRTDNWEASRAFYCDLLGFEVAFVWRHAPNFPVYAGVVKEGIRLDISEHTGDAEVGATVAIRVEDVDATYRELRERGADAPEPQSHPWGLRDFNIRDPDGNKLSFFTPTGS